MPTSTEDKMNGAANTLKGKAKRIAGEINDDENLKDEGDMDKLKGAAQTLKGKAKDAIKRGMNKI
jgi:uncharacterized protein YjbJ (UPF0337 family)